MRRQRRKKNLRRINANGRRLLITENDSYGGGGWVTQKRVLLGTLNDNSCLFAVIYFMIIQPLGRRIALVSL